MESLGPVSGACMRTGPGPGSVRRPARALYMIFVKLETHPSYCKPIDFYATLMLDCTDVKRVTGREKFTHVEYCSVLTNPHKLSKNPRRERV